MPLTDEDKAWFTKLVGGLDAKIFALEAKFDAKFEVLDTKIAALDTKIETVNARIEKVETTLLTEFHKWASPVVSRIRANAENLRALELDLQLISDKVKKLEGPSASPAH
jgi:prefoldin subunit 5